MTNKCVFYYVCLILCFISIATAQVTDHRSPRLNYHKAKRSFYFINENGDELETVQNSSLEFTTTTNHPAVTISSVKLSLQNTCGQTNVIRDRIIGGESPKLGDWPWVAVLGYKNQYKLNSPIQWKCGGSLIAVNFVLTSAYCTLNNSQSKLLIVRLGDLNLNHNLQDGASPLDMTIDKIIPHESYDSIKFTNDISLLKLKTPVKLTQHIQPICLPLSQKLRTKLFVRFVPTVAGWGSTSSNGPLSTALMEIGVPVLENHICKDTYAKFPVTIDNRTLCAGYINKGKGPCQGDSGSPLMLPQSGQWYSIGIASFGYKCGETGYPVVYTRVTHFVDWIVEKMNSA